VLRGLTSVEEVLLATQEDTAAAEVAPASIRNVRV
jgi:hypothetical protein